MHRFTFAALAVSALAVPLLGQQPAPDKAKPRRVLPGLDATGAVRLHNQWSLRPAGKQVELGDFPVAAALHPSGQWLAVLHAGYGPHEIHIVNLDSTGPRVANRVTLKQTFGGLAFTPDGKTLLAGGGEFDVVHRFRFEKDAGLLADYKSLEIPKKTDKFIPNGMAVSPDGKTVYVAGTWGHAVSVLYPDEPKRAGYVPLGKDSYPYGCLLDKAGETLYVSLWNKAQVAVINLKLKTVVRHFSTEKHPTEMLLSPDGKALFVACSNSTQVSVVSVADGKNLETIHCALYPKAPSGNTPNSLALTPGGELLFVTNADANNVAVFNVSKPGKAKPLGFIPAGMYPTAVRLDAAAKKLYVVNARGIMPKSNRHGPNPIKLGYGGIREYIGGLYRGTLSVLDIPTEERMVAYTQQALLCSPLRPDAGATGERPADSPIPAKVGDASPIKHCIYIIRENRTYDQVLGDIKEGNGDASLCIFPEKVTPNAHRLARQFVLLDNFYVDGEVSADGHEWSMGAYATDFVKKVWPLAYRGSPTKKMNIYPSEGMHDDIERPAGGYIWDRCAEAKVSYRSYGEWVENGKTPKDPAKAQASRRWRATLTRGSAVTTWTTPT